MLHISIAHFTASRPKSKTIFASHPYLITLTINKELEVQGTCM